MKPLKAGHWWRNRLVAASHKTGRREVRHGAPPASDFACLAQVRASLVGSCAPRQVEMSEPAMKSAVNIRQTSAPPRSPGRAPVATRRENKRMFRNRQKTTLRTSSSSATAAAGVTLNSCSTILPESYRTETGKRSQRSCRVCELNNRATVIFRTHLLAPDFAWLTAQTQQAGHMQLAMTPPTFTSFLFSHTGKPGESANAVPHYHKLCSRVSHIWGNRRGQHIRSAMDKPRPGKTTFVIMVSPLPGKYELPAGRPTATSYALHCTHTLTFLPASPSLLGPSTQRIHVLSSKNSSVLSHATGDHIVFKHQMTDQQPLRSDIYIRHAPFVTSREPALPSSPRPALVPASLLPRRPAGPTGRRAPSGGSDVRPPPLFSHPPRVGTRCARLPA